MERAFGDGKFSVGGHSNSVEEWYVGKPNSTIATDGFSYTQFEGQLIEGLIWSVDPKSHKRGRRKLGKGKGWLGKITLGMSRAEALKIASQILGKPKVEDGVYEWSQTGWSYPYDLNSQNPFDRWDAYLSFEASKVSEIEVDAIKTTSRRQYPQFRKDFRG